MRLRWLAFLFLTCCSTVQLFAYRVSGIITHEGKELPYTAVYEKGTTYGVVSNIKGIYLIELAEGNHTLVYQSIGYQTIERSITVSGNLTLNIEMVLAWEMLETAIIDTDREDPAYPIMRKAIERRKTINQNLNSYQGRMYLKASLEVEDLERPDTTTPDLNTKKRVNLIESLSDVYYLKPNLFKEVKQAYRDLATKKNNTVSVSFNVSDDNAVENIEITNPYLFYTKLSDGNFDFNQSLLHLPVISDVPFTSPLADNALKSYSYRLLANFQEGDKWIYKIAVKPLNASRNLVAGTIYIEDSTYTLNAIDLDFLPASLRFFSNFKLIQNYEHVGDNLAISRQEFYYDAAMESGRTAFGHTVVQLKDHMINPTLSRKFMQRGTLIFDRESYTKGEEFWAEVRPITLKSIEMDFVHTQDSINIHHSSVEYLDQQDSIHNNLKIWNFLLTGIQHQNHKKGLKLYAYPLIQQIKINTVDGYRHTLGGIITKEWKNGKELETAANIDYGLLNKNIRGEVALRYLYNPLDFSRFRIKYGNKYTMINTHESIQATFSPSNYSDNISYGIGHEREWFNGFFVRAYLDYNQFQPYNGKTIENFWKNFPLFSEPQDFDPFEELVLSISTRLTFAQNYELRPNRKIIMGSKFPIVRINYSKGIKPWLRSDVNYDFVEITGNQYIRLAKMGVSQLSFEAGRYLNDREVRLSNLKYFRGSDKYYFSNPLRTFQQVGPISLRTSKAYVGGHYIHHFNGAILGRSKILNRMRLQLATGTGLLYLEETNLKHIEVFAGLERPFRLWGQIFRFDVHYVTSTNSQFGFNQGIKFGIDFYNGYAHRWQY